jgi:serine/threonine protein kinase
MEIICTRPHCPHPQNSFPDLDDSSKLKTAQQKYCMSCGMPLILAGRYIPTKLLGQGGFGAAFLAKDRFTPTMRECVVKQFQPSGNLTGKQLEIAENLFEREAAVLERLGNKHQQIPDLFAFFPLIVPSMRRDREEQYFYLAQEFIDGQDLEQELTVKGTFTEDEVRFVLIEILKVLRFVHANNSIHRDIKPSNIMRDREGVLFLLDFGAVKEVTAGAGAGSGRSTGIYSPGYAPPEQMSGAQVFPATDLYALAVTCITLLTGKPPDELYDPYNNCWDWYSKTSHVSQELKDILDIMLSTSVKDRFQSAEDILNLLHSPLTSPPVTITQPPIPPQPSITQPPISQPPVSQPPVVTPPAPPIQAVAKAQFSLLEIIGSSAFTGFEGALLAIAMNSLVGLNPLTVGIWGIIVGVLVFAQYRRIIERKDLPILVVISILIMLIPALNHSAGFMATLLIGLFAGAGSISVMALFRLVYQLLSRFL